MPDQEWTPVLMSLLSVLVGAVVAIAGPLVAQHFAANRQYRSDRSEALREFLRVLAEVALEPGEPWKKRDTDRTALWLRLQVAHDGLDALLTTKDVQASVYSHSARQALQDATDPETRTRIVYVASTTLIGWHRKRSALPEKFALSEGKPYAGLS